MAKNSKYAKVSIWRDTADLIEKLQKKHQPRMPFVLFIHTIAKSYQKNYCPECGSELKTKACSCKASERL